MKIDTFSLRYFIPLVFFFRVFPKFTIQKLYIRYEILEKRQIEVYIHPKTHLSPEVRSYFDNIYGFRTMMKNLMKWIMHGYMHCKISKANLSGVYQFYKQEGKWLTREMQNNLLIIFQERACQMKNVVEFYKIYTNNEYHSFAFYDWGSFHFECVIEKYASHYTSVEQIQKMDTFELELWKLWTKQRIIYILKFVDKHDEDMLRYKLASPGICTLNRMAILLILSNRL